MAKDQQIRKILFIISVVVFLTGLPFILSFTLGYKFDPANLKFTMTGLISLKSTPQGAVVSLNGKEINERTPCSIDELLPGRYRIGLTLAGHYPYTADVEVQARKVTRMEKIMLFPLRSDVQQLNKERISWFWVEEGRSLFYVDTPSSTLYRSDLDGERFEPFAAFVAITPPAFSWKFSPDRQRLVYFNGRSIGVVCLEKGSDISQQAFVLDASFDAIKEVFWYSDSYHIIVHDVKAIWMLETQPGARPFELVALKSPASRVWYQPENDAVYFQDSQQGADGMAYDNVYRLELGRKLFPFRDFMRAKPKEQER